MRKLILTNYQAPGDVLMLTAAVRDLHECYPGQFITDVRTSCPELWENNPYLTALDPRDPAVESLVCEYPLIHRSDRHGAHFIHGFIEFLNEHLDLRIRPSRFQGDVHLSAAEKRRRSPLGEVTGADLPYWIIVAGGKYDYTIKWWHFRRWQAVVDHFCGRLLFVQVGKLGDYHPPLRHVIDLRGRTTLRESVRLMHHAQGVVCPVTFHMHLAAAVEPRRGEPGSRPCVVVAGGRESPHWEAYPAHQFIHTVGALSCCATGGCWRSRVLPLGDGDSKDGPEHLCVDVTRSLPRCMDYITPDEVNDRIERYLAGGRADVLADNQWNSALPFLRPDEMVFRSGLPSRVTSTQRTRRQRVQLATNCS